MSLTAKAQQRFFNLTAEQVRIDSLLPVFTHHVPLGPDYADSVYTVSIVYPEFIPMSDADIARYARITSDPLPAMPKVSRVISVDRKCGELTLSFVPLVFRDGQYQKLVSFMLEVRGERLEVRSKRSAVNGKRAATQRYADHSVLATGKWTKIRVPSTGIYQINSELIKKAGFSDINKVKVYGYGGGMQPEILTADYLAETDDLMEVTTCETGGRKLFYAIGPVTWDANNKRIRNPYSSYGYYFLTENDSTAQTMSEAEFIEKYYPLADDYNSLYEVDDFAWYHGGRNLYDATVIAAGGSHTFTVPAKGAGQEGVMTAIVTADDATTVYVSVNDVTVDTLRVLAHGGYEQMRQAESVKKLHNLQASNKVTLQTLAGGGTTRLDYISIHVNEPAAAPDLSATFPTPEYVYGITNQDHHADPFADMVIIIPTTQKLKAQAERLKTMHEQKDGLRVTIVPADELFNEFSSGTPDANAYRRYLKMLYDRAGTDVDMPRYLLLLGDGAWDNRMLSVEWKDYSPDDFLLCYESENSSSATDCYVTDDYFCLLDDDEGGSMLVAKGDVAVGRISARTADDAGIAVDKIESYVNNENAGAWQNLLCFMGDDGNENAHMQDADSVAREVERLYPTYQIKRVMWDAYTRVSSSTGNSYPDVTRLIKQQMQQGALIMNYSGHGRADAISHEYVLRLADFENVSSRLPLWLTASCDIMPFDGQEENIGETAFFNKKGGAVAFYGTTRTVYQTQNRLMNLAFTRHVLSQNNSGQLLPIGEAVRRAKNELIETGIITGYANGQPIYSSDRTQNKLQYTLLGDPAMRLAAPTMGIRIDSINGTPLVDGQTQKLEAGSTATLSGHVLERDGQLSADYNGTLTATVCDALEKIVCKMNDPSETSEPFVYYDRPNTLFNGSNVVKNGRFTLTFAVPKDISYSDANGLINLYAVNDDKTKKASGICCDVLMSGSGGLPQGGAGPNIYCFLNSEAFVNGGSVNPTPYFVAQLNDEDGINAAGSGIGHDLQLIIDGEMTKTYSLNDYFQYDFGSYTSGTIGFSIPALSYGEHKLLFRAWVKTRVVNPSTSIDIAPQGNTSAIGRFPQYRQHHLILFLLLGVVLDIDIQLCGEHRHL